MLQTETIQQTIFRPWPIFMPKEKKQSLVAEDAGTLFKERSTDGLMFKINGKLMAVRIIYPDAPDGEVFVFKPENIVSRNNNDYYDMKREPVPESEMTLEFRRAIRKGVIRHHQSAYRKKRLVFE